MKREYSVIQEARNTDVKPRYFATMKTAECSARRQCAINASSRWEIYHNDMLVARTMQDGIGRVWTDIDIHACALL